MIAQRKSYILILGGTNFIGKTLLDQLQQTPYNICCINRGKVYWNNQAHNQHANVQWFISDRKDHRDYTSTLRFAAKHLGISSDNPWAAVIDFCGYKWRDVQSALHGVEGLTKLYIFISTDSVYNNFLHKSSPITEKSFDLEAEYQRIKASEKKGVDSYGYDKLKCQLYLHRKKTVPFVCLRLSDVIGPYDNTDRFWTTLKWLQQSQKYPLPISNQDEQVQLSFVDSISVAKFIITLINAQAIPSTSYNLSSTQTCTLYTFLQLIRKKINKNANYKAVHGSSSNQFYPSVECGPINCQKATQQLGWNPLTLEQVIGITVEFFLKQGDNYTEEKANMEKVYRKKVIEKYN